MTSFDIITLIIEAKKQRDGSVKKDQSPPPTPALCVPIEIGTHYTYCPVKNQPERIMACFTDPVKDWMKANKIKDAIISYVQNGAYHFQFARFKNDRDQLLFKMRWT